MGRLARSGPGKAIVDGVRSLGLEVRGGVHTGEVEQIGEGDVGGIAVHVWHASPQPQGEVLVSSSVPDLVAGSGLSFVVRGTHPLKEVAEERQLFALSA